MNPTELLALYDDTMRRNASVAGCTREKTAQSSRYSTASGCLRYVMWHEFSAADTDSCIVEEITAATGSVKALMWKVYDHDAPTNLGERLLTVICRPRSVHANGRADDTRARRAGRCAESD